MGESVHSGNRRDLLILVSGTTGMMYRQPVPKTEGASGEIQVR